MKGVATAGVSRGTFPMQSSAGKREEDMASGFPDWLRAVQMLGQYAGEHKIVAVTEAGNLYVLLQGETAAGALQTVRLDSEGRMSAFVIDSVDAWNRMLTIGNAELAVRLGSSVAYDRRGQVLFVESFEQGWYKWTLGKSGTGADGKITAAVAATGGYCVELTGGSDAAMNASIERWVTSRPAGRMGLEFSFALPGSWREVLAQMYFYTGALEIEVSARFDLATGDILINDRVFGYHSVGSGQVLAADAKAFNTLKVVADVDTLKYVRLMYNQQEINLSTKDLPWGGDGTAPSVKVMLTNYSRGGFNDVMYIDDVILTMAEPE